VSETSAAGPAVLLVSGEYPPLRGGVGDYTARLAHALAERERPVTVVTRPLPVSPGATVSLRTVTGWGRPLWRLLGDLRRSGWQGVVHLQYQAGAFDLSGWVTLLPLLARPLPVVTTFHDLRVPYLFPKAGRLRAGVLRLLARTSAAVVATNPEDERVLRRWGVPSDRLWRIPIGSNLPQPQDPLGARGRLDIPTERALVVFFGFRQPEKGLDTLVAALALLPEPRPALVVLGGERPDAPGAAGEGAADPVVPRGVPVRDLGYRPAQEVSDLLAAADLVVLPFRHGASLRNGTLVAALACGAAVVTTAPADPGMLRPLRDGQHLQLVPPGDASALAGALAALLADGDRRARLRAGARAVSAYFAWERIAARHEQLYRVVLGCRRTA